MNMTNYRLADLNLIYKIQEILEDNGIPNGQYRVMDGYPNEEDLTQDQVWPTITVEMDGVYGRDIELGSNQWPSFPFSIDIFAVSDSQRDDIAFLLWQKLNEIIFRFYDFNSGFPSAVGSYTGITNNAEWTIDNLTIINLAPPKNALSEGEKHHALLDGLLFLPNL